MSDLSQALIEAAKQVPAMVVLFAVVWLMLDREDKREMKRDAAAKDLELMRQKFESENNAMWAAHVKTIVEGQQTVFKAIADSLADHEKASKERYEKMGITKDLLNAATEREREQRSKHGRSES